MSWHFFPISIPYNKFYQLNLYRQVSISNILFVYCLKTFEINWNKSWMMWKTTKWKSYAIWAQIFIFFKSRSITVRISFLVYSSRREIKWQKSSLCKLICCIDISLAQLQAYFLSTVNIEISLKYNWNMTALSEVTTVRLRPPELVRKKFSSLYSCAV